MALNFQLQLVDGITPGARSAKRSLDQLDSQLRLVDRDLDQSARRRARAQAQQLQGDRQTAAQSRATVASRARDVNELVRLEERAGAARVRAARRTEDEINRSLNRQLAREERAERQRQNTRARTAHESGRSAMGVVLGGVGAVAAAGGALLTAVGAYGDDQRARNRANQQLDYQIAQLASGDIGDPRAAAEIRAAVDRTSMATGMDAGGVLQGLATAQGRFAALGNATDRADYLANVLPELARVSVATNSPLQDVVATAGELQRQLGITNHAMPDTLAQMIQMGRNGSITFADMAQNLGQLGGMTARFMRTTGADSAHATALTGSLYQFAGRAGLGGSEAATSTRSLLQNLTSSRGQRRLNAVLGTNAFDNRGQLRAAAGQGQDDAFIRMIETVYGRTGGNSARFTEALAGHNVEAGALTNQLFQDLVAHGGHLTDFRTMDQGAVGATAANTQDRAAEAILQTRAAQDAMREERIRVGSTTSDFGQAADATQRYISQLRETSPFFASLIDNGLVRGGMDSFHMRERMGMPTMPDAGDTSPEAQVRRNALLAARNQLAGGGTVDALARFTMFTPAQERAGIEAQARENESAAILAAIERRFGGTFGSRPIDLSPDSIARMREALIAASAEIYRDAAGGSAPGGGGVFRAWLQGGD